MHRRQPVRDSADGAHAELAGGVDGDQHVVDVVQAVERGNFAKAIGNQAFDPKLDDVVGNEVEAHDALGPGESAHRRLHQLFPHAPHPLPGVFFQIAHADVELNGAGQVDAFEADVVHHVGHGQHVGCCHSRRPQALVRVAQRGVDDADVCSGHAFILFGVDSAAARNLLSTQLVLTRPARKSSWLKTS